MVESDSIEGTEEKQELKLVAPTPSADDSHLMGCIELRRSSFLEILFVSLVQLANHLSKHYLATTNGNPWRLQLYRRPLHPNGDTTSECTGNCGPH
jgi:hypothetical protein